MNSDEAAEIVKAAARLVIDAMAGMLQDDPHQWSERPCATCKSISGFLGRAFGCYLLMEQRAERRREQERKP